VFRGVTIAGMLLVNNPGSWSAVYPPLQHAEWHGWTPTDLIFPFFLFIVGVAMIFSFRTQLEKGMDRQRILVKAAKRAVILFGLGLMLHAFPWWKLDLSTLRIPGVLQRIALAFLLATPAVLWLRFRAQATLAAALLLGYWAVMRLVPVPGIGAGVWEPGMDLGAWVDRAVFGTSHLRPGTWDSLGLLSTVPATATVLLGVLTGQWLRSRASCERKVLVMLVGGCVGIALGLLWDQLFPINKNLWTSSFAVFTTGIALLLLAGCYWLIDVRGHRRWTYPFVLFGINAILVYVLASLGDMMLHSIRVGAAGAMSAKTAIYKVFFASWLPPLNASLAYAAACLLFWLLVMAVLHRRGIHVKI
jgi:predicted acyltransferase